MGHRARWQDHAKVGKRPRVSTSEPAANTRGTLRSLDAASRLGLTRLTAILGVAVAFLIPIFPVPWSVYDLLGKLGLSYILRCGLVQLALECIVVVLIPILFGFVQGQDLRRLLRAEKGGLFGDIASAIGAFLLVMAVTAAKWWPEVAPQPALHSGTLASPVLTPYAYPLMMRIAISVTNGISEELGCRAYAILTLESSGVPAAWTAVICLVCSVAIHVPAWGLHRQVILIQLVFVLLYEYRRRLIASGFAHILSDGFPLVILQLMPAPIQRMF